jgi:hypothetical protein
MSSASTSARGGRRGAPHPRPLADRVRQADFFAPIAEAPFDLVYERAFLCALPRRLWPSWATRVAELVKPGGRLAGTFLLTTATAARPSRSTATKS